MESLEIIEAPAETEDQLAAIYIQRLVECLREVGRPFPENLAAIEVSASESRLSLCSYGSYLKLVEWALSELDIPDLSVRYGSRFTLTDYGVLGYAMLSCGSLRKLVDILSSYVRLLGGSRYFAQSHHIGIDEVTYRIDSSLPPGRVRQFELEANIVQHIRGLTDLNVGLGEPFSRVNLAFGRSDSAPAFEKFVDCPVNYNQDATELIFPVRWLDRRLKASDKTTATICEAQCAKMLERLDHSHQFSRRVKDVIMSAPGATPSFAEVADALRLGTRTLRRRLAAEGSSYQEIVNEVRMSMANRYLRETNIAIKEISYLLGYSEPANFQRAFKGWFGKTPGAVRSNAGSGMPGQSKV